MILQQLLIRDYRVLASLKPMLLQNTVVMKIHLIKQWVGIIILPVVTIIKVVVVHNMLILHLTSLAPILQDKIMVVHNLMDKIRRHRSGEVLL
jgi:hypothetical protein